MIFKFSETHYFFEAERKDRINRQATFTGAIAAVYFPLIASLLSEYDLFKFSDIVSYVFFILSMVFAIVFLVRFFAFFGHEFYYIADPQEVWKKYCRAQQFDRDIGGPPSERKAVAEALAEDYAYCASRNRTVNNLKSRLLLDANRAVFSGVICGAFSYFFLIAIG